MMRLMMIGRPTRFENLNPEELGLSYIISNLSGI
jgi:hypothetical protein